MLACPQRFSASESSGPQSFTFSSPLNKTAASNPANLSTPAAKPAAVLGEEVFCLIFFFFFTTNFYKCNGLNCHHMILSMVAAPVRPVQTSTPPTVVQKPAPAAQNRVQTPQVLIAFILFLTPSLLSFQTSLMLCWV